MSNKKNFSGLSSDLAEQVKARFNGNENNREEINKSDDNEIEIVNKNVIIQKEKSKQKIFYLIETYCELLRKAAYEKNKNQTEIINEALKDYFIKIGYMKENKNSD